MVRSTTEDERPLESYLKPNSFLQWKDQIYRILSRDLIAVQVESVPALEPHMFKIVDLVDLDGEAPPVFAPTLDKLREKLEKLRPPPTRSTNSNLPQSIRRKAERMVKEYKEINWLLAEKKDDKEKLGEEYHRTEELKAICEARGIVIATYYNHHDRYREYNGDQAAIAASFRRPRSLGHSRLTDAQLHLVDSAIVKYYARKPAIRKVTLYETIKSTYTRTGGQWIDPVRCGGKVPQDLVDQLFDDKLPFQAILENPEKARWLVPIEKLKRTWVYDRISALEKQPDEGKSLIIARYGEEMWEYEQKIFDHFAHIAKRPLQYVFADYCLLKVFIVDEATRSEPSRLWLTLLIDAYSRSVLGFALTYEGPCIDTIQDALLSAIQPKTWLKKLGIEGEWPCYGIPVQLSLDNAWSNHSHSLESLAGLISQNGEYCSWEEQAMIKGTRNASGQGSIYLRKDGRWVAAISIAHKRRSFYGKTRQEAQEKLKKALYELPRRTLNGVEHPSVEQFIKHWLVNLAGTTDASTYTRYEQLVRLHIIPELGSLYLKKLTSQHLTTFYKNKIEQGLSPSTIVILHTCLYQTLTQAIQEDYIEHDACEEVALPKKANDVIHPLTKEQARQFLKVIRGHKYEAFFALALATGMKRGELLALKWQDVDLSIGLLQVCRTFNQKQTQEIIYAEGGSKAYSNPRSIIIAPFAFEPLKQFRMRQLEAKSQAGNHWHNLDLVFCTSNGEPLPPGSALKSFKRVLQAESLPPIRFLDLRHTIGVLLLDQGVHPKVVQELLGQRNINTTINLYKYGTHKSQREVIHQLNNDLQG